jgi:hypothetical protein
MRKGIDYPRRNNMMNHTELSARKSQSLMPQRSTKSFLANTSPAMSTKKHITRVEWPHYLKARYEEKTGVDLLWIFGCSEQHRSKGSSNETIAHSLSTGIA